MKKFEKSILREDIQAYRYGVWSRDQSTVCIRIVQKLIEKPEMALRISFCIH